MSNDREADDDPPMGADGSATSGDASPPDEDEEQRTPDVDEAERTPDVDEAERTPEGDEAERTPEGDERPTDPDPDPDGDGAVGPIADHDDAVEDRDDVIEEREGSIEDLGSAVEIEADVDEENAEDDLIGGLQIDSTVDIQVPDRLVDQVIGQEHARDVVMKAAKQRRHVMMIGSPGTGKSMLAKAMSELLPREELQDVLVYHNPDDGNEPKVRTVPAGKGEQIVEAHKEEARKRNQMRSFLMWIIIAIVLGYSLIIAGQILLGILAAGVIYLAFRYGSRGSDSMIPNLIVNNADTKTAPFEDATGAHAGALLGDVRHDPFQSGGMETPSH
ncbi:MAG: ATP-binding protein, partial [Haloferacaceae archaeon]